MFATCVPPRLFIDNCLAAALCIVAEAHAGEYDGMIPGLWFFGLQPGNFGPRLGDLIIDICEVELFEAFRCHYGLTATWHRCDDPAEVRQVMHQELVHGRPAGVMIDTGQCSWSPKFRKDVGEHMLIVDRALPDSRYRCVDTISSKPEAIGLESIAATFATNPKIAGKVLLFAKSGRAAGPWQAANGVYGGGGFQTRRAGVARDIRAFAKRLRDADLGFERGSFHAPAAVPIYYRPAFLSNGREALANTLARLGGPCEPLAQDIAALSNSWSQIRAQIMVACERKTGGGELLAGVAEQIDRLANRENAALDRMADLFGWT
jgi:hypothetical protein